MVESNRVSNLYSRLRNRLLNSRKTKLKKLSPLSILVILSVVVGGVIAVGTWYWGSNPITMTISVTGYLTAKANVNPLTAWDEEVKVAFANLVEESVFFDGAQVDLLEGPKYVFVRLGNTNAETIYTKVTAARHAGMFVTCEVCIVDRKGIDEYYYPTEFHWHDLGAIAVDGSQSMQLIASADGGAPDSLYMMKEPGSHMRYAMYRFTVGQGSLPPGTHTLSVVIEIGDTATP